MSALSRGPGTPIKTCTHSETRPPKCTCIGTYTHVRIHITRATAAIPTISRFRYTNAEKQVESKAEEVDEYRDLIQKALADFSVAQNRSDAQVISMHNHVLVHVHAHVHVRVHVRILYTITRALPSLCCTTPIRPRTSKSWNPASGTTFRRLPACSHRSMTTF